MILHLLHQNFIELSNILKISIEKIFKGLAFAKIIIKIKENKKNMFTN